jgi:hypothetical protein
MSISSRFLFSAAMDVSPDRERLFHEVYDTASTRSTSWRAPRSCCRRRGPRPSRRAAGRPRFVRTPATGAT